MASDYATYMNSHLPLEHSFSFDAQRQQQQYPYGHPNDYTFIPYSEQQAYQQSYQNSPFTFQPPSEYLTSSSSPFQESYQLPPSSPQQNQPYYQPPVHPSKRLYPDDDDAREDEADAPEQPPDPKENKVKSGACQRCKGLKVKCIFKTDTDPCKRCLNGGHECVIPGRKKRRTPPKREHLLNQIHEQAEQIKKLMAQLEETNKLHLSTSLPSDVPNSDETTVNPETNKVVEDWLSKAKDSLAEFDEFIGAGMPKSYIVQVDPEDPPSSDDEWTDVGDDSVKDYDMSVVSDEGSTSERAESATHRRLFASSTESGVRAKKKDIGGEKLATLPSEAVPFGLMAGLSLRNQKKRSSSGEVEADPELGVANEDFFRSSPEPDPRHSRIDIIGAHAPNIITRGIITPREAEDLFKIYYETMNLSLSLLDPVLYTAQRTFSRSSFMFTVICALASRFYTERPGLHNELMHYAQLAAGTALIGGPKNIELCIGYILLGLYPVPTKRWEDERGCLYIGLAIRIAIDLNLHLPNTAKPQNELHAREQLNRTRIWLNCHNLDRSTGSQYGKAPIISNTDYTACHSGDWWRHSEYNLTNFDIHICCYNEELRAMARFISRIYNDPSHPTGLNKDIAFEKLATETDEELQQITKKWFAIIDQTDMSDEQNRFRTGLLRLAFPYARLVALSYGFQYGKHSADEENPFFLRCLAAATDVVHGVVNNLGTVNHRIYLARGPVAQSVYLAFAAAFLVKLLQPKFAFYLTPEKQLEMIELVQSAIDLLENIAVDEHHGPKLYARFLKGLLAKVETSSTSKTQFAPPAGMVDPFAQLSTSTSTTNNMNVNISNFFYPPLPYDNDTMQGMQSFTDPTWQDMASLPDLNLMGQFQSQSPQMYHNGYMTSLLRPYF